MTVRRSIGATSRTPNKAPHQEFTFPAPSTKDVDVKGKRVQLKVTGDYLNSLDKNIPIRRLNVNKNGEVTVRQPAKNEWMPQQWDVPTFYINSSVKKLVVTIEGNKAPVVPKGSGIKITPNTGNKFTIDLSNAKNLEETADIKFLDVGKNGKRDDTSDFDSNFQTEIRIVRAKVPVSFHTAAPAQLSQ